jgi:hypothetical protein
MLLRGVAGACHDGLLSSILGASDSDLCPCNFIVLPKAMSPELPVNHVRNGDETCQTHEPTATYSSIVHHTLIYCQPR